MRGTNSNHVLVLRDGMPITDASDPTAAFNFGIDTLSDIERIEIIRGPMAALYGSGAIGGVINLISRRGTEPGMHWSGDLAGGYPALIRGSVTASGVRGADRLCAHRGVAVAARLRLPSRSGKASTAGVPQGFRDRILTLNLGYTPIEGTRLSLFLRAQTAYFGFDTFGSFDAAAIRCQPSTTPTPTAIHHRCWAVSAARRILFDGRLESGLFVGQLQNDRRYLEPLAAHDPNQASSDSRYHAYRTDVQWNNTLHLDDFVTRARPVGQRDDVRL